MKNYLKLTVIVLLIYSCSDNKTIQDYGAKIIDKEYIENGSADTYKTRIYVELENELSKKDLKNISYKIKENNDKNKLIYISYTLPGMEKSLLGWANAEFTPDFKLKLNGLDKEDKNILLNIKAPNNSSKIIGKWYDDSPYVEKSIIFYETLNDSLFCKSLSENGKFEEVKKISKTLAVDNLSRFNYKNENGEYFIIDKSGNLILRDSKGIITKYDRIK
jgi:hypothetical protein